MSVSPNPSSDSAAFLKGAQTLADNVGTGVVGAIQRAAHATGVDFSYLVKTAQRESSLNPNARARSSSAAGLFQFIEQTWLGMLKANGARHGYGAYADQISKGRDGRYHVNDPSARQAVLALRYNPDANAVMAAEMTAGHAAYLRGRIGRDPTQGELYAAHFLGPDGAADLINANATRPQATAASLFPQAAHANRGIFYDHGRALPVSDVLANLTRTAGNTPVLDSGAQDGGDGMLVAGLNRLRNEQMLLSMMFGGQGQALGLGQDTDTAMGQNSLLLTAQLMSGFAPDAEGDAANPDNDMNGLWG